MEKIVIGVVVGSLRRGSYNRKIAEALAGMMPDRFEMRMLDISGLPLYNQDLDDDGKTPAAWADFRAEVKAVDGLLFVTPEYNRSMPPVLKNALDVASRPYGQNSWNAKPGAVVSVSPGKQGGFGANHHLRQCMAFLNVYMMQQPEAYIGGVAEMLNENGGIADERSRAFLQTIADGFAAWVEMFVKK